MKKYHHAGNANMENFISNSNIAVREAQKAAELHRAALASAEHGMTGDVIQFSWLLKLPRGLSRGNIRQIVTFVSVEKYTAGEVTVISRVP